MEERDLFEVSSEMFLSVGNLHGKMTNDRATEIFCDMQKGDYSHFIELYEAAKVKIRVIAHSYSMEESCIDDFYQDVWVELFERIEKYDRKRAGFFTWMNMIAKTKLFKDNEKKEKEKAFGFISLDTDDAPEIGTSENVEQNFLILEDYRKAMDCLDKLPDDQKLAIKLCEIKGCKPAEAADVAECSAADIYRNKHRGLKKIAAMMQERDIDLW